MGRNARFSKEEKLRINERHHKGEAASDLAREYECNRSMIYEWYKKYSVIGDSAFYETRRENIFKRT